MKKRVIVLGTTGAMGRYLLPQLVKCGFYVDDVTIADVPDNERQYKNGSIYNGS